MSIIYLVTNDAETFSFDATLSLNSTLNNDVTEYPVESGFDITKGVIKKSDTFTLTGLISDYHIKESREFRSNEIFAELRQLKERRSIVTLVNGSSVFPNLVISSITSDEDSASGFAKNITIAFTEIRTATSASTKVPRSALQTNTGDNVADKASSLKNDGTKSKEVIEENDTTFLRVINGLFSGSEDDDE